MKSEMTGVSSEFRPSKLALRSDTYGSIVARKRTAGKAYFARKKDLKAIKTLFALPKVTWSLG